MHVVNPRREAHNDAVFDGDRQMVPRVAKKLRPQRVVDGPVEDPVSDVVQDVLVAGSQDPEL